MDLVGYDPPLNLRFPPYLSLIALSYDIHAFVHVLLQLNQDSGCTLSDVCTKAVTEVIPNVHP